MNRKFLYVDNDCEYTEELESITVSTGASDAGRLITTNADGMIDSSLLPESNGVGYTAGAAGVTAGGLVFVSGPDTISPVDIMVAQTAIGVAMATGAAGDSVVVHANDTIVTGVLTGATPGDKYYWDGTALTTTAPTAPGTRVWLVGVARNATDLHVEVKFINKNS